MAITGLHVIANLVWVGSLLAAVVLARGDWADVGARGQAARRVYRMLAVPAFVASLLLGVIRLGLDWHLYMVATHFMHAKLVLALAAIVAHHWVGARVKALGPERAGAERWLGPLGLGFAVACFGAAWLAVVKPF